jgi:hypothetical protein
MLHDQQAKAKIQRNAGSNTVVLDQALPRDKRYVGLALALRFRQACMANTTNGPSRAEFLRLEGEVLKLADRINETTRELGIQFERMAQLQADVDIIRAAWAKTDRRKQRSTRSKTK